MENKTNALRFLDRCKADYKIYTYHVDASLSGTQIAVLLGENPQQVFKTLVTVSKSRKNYVFMVPVNAELNLKKAAIAVGEKNLELIKQKELFPLTGYVHGGCSPLGMKKKFPIFIDGSAAQFSTIIFSGGRVGLQVETSFETIQKILDVQTADLI